MHQGTTAAHQPEIRLPRAQLEALREAGARPGKHIWPYNPNSRYSGPWEPGKHHFTVIRRLEERGYLRFERGGFTAGIGYGGGYAITQAGLDALRRKEQAH